VTSLRQFGAYTRADQATPQGTPLDRLFPSIPRPLLPDGPGPNWLASLLTGLCACAPGSPGGSDGVPWAETGSTPAYTVRGRWSDATAITYHVDGARAGAASGAGALAQAVDGALRTWSAAGQVRFEPATDILGADILFSFEAPSHAGCADFGTDTSVAHAGLPGAGTFVHFDATCAWGTEASLEFAALHEVGHVLGLDHTEHSRSLMYVAAEEGQAQLGAGERAGIATLYGGDLAPHPSDLWVRSGDGSQRVLLWRAAPPETTDFIVFDADGDGRDEALVWRTDTAGAGVLTLYFFDDDMQLMRTVGPLWGSVIPGAAITFTHLPSGHRVVSCTAPGSAAVRRGFDDQGLLTRVVPAETSSGARLATNTGDLDGDGEAETLHRAP